MNKVVRKILPVVISTSIIYFMAVAVSATNGKEVKRFSGVMLGNYEMSGELEGSLTGGYAMTRCNKPVYYIAANVTGYVIGDDGDRVDLGDDPRHRNNDNYVYTFIGGFEPIGVKTGSFWSSHEIRDGVSGVGHYLATIDV